MGPVDASFWLGYRLKANRFDASPYFGEPSGQPWHRRLWEQSGYQVSDRYYSHTFGTPPAEYANPKYQERLASFLDAGYEIASPEPSAWDKAITEVHGLITGLYSDFPAFKTIDADDFKAHYASLRHILDLSLVKLAYWQGQAVGFFIAVPDYGYALNGRLGPLALARLAWTRRFAQRYVMLYIGVLPEHQGLGKALTQTIIEALVAKRRPSIGALMHEGKPTLRFVEEMVVDKCEYLLFSKGLGTEG
jgi:GNAT superfamily N-acetyltransferase